MHSMHVVGFRFQGLGFKVFSIGFMVLLPSEVVDVCMARTKYAAALGGSTPAATCVPADPLCLQPLWCVSLC